MTGGSLQAAVVLSQQLHDALGVAPVAEALFQHLRSRFQGLAGLSKDKPLGGALLLALAVLLALSSAWLRATSGLEKELF